MLQHGSSHTLGSIPHRQVGEFADGLLMQVDGYRLQGRGFVTTRFLYGRFIIPPRDGETIQGYKQALYLWIGSQTRALRL